MDLCEIDFVEEPQECFSEIPNMDFSDGPEFWFNQFDTNFHQFAEMRYRPRQHQWKPLQSVKNWM